MIVLPEHVLRLMSPADRQKYGMGCMTAAEAASVAIARSEKQLQNQLEALLRRNDIVVIRQRMDRKSNIAEGLPDIMFAVGEEGEGTPVAWECKMPRENPTPKQLQKHEEMRRNGWTVRVIRSYHDGLTHLIELLEAT